MADQRNADLLDPSTPERPGLERRRSRNPLKNMMQHLSVESPDEDGATSPRRESLIRRLSRRGSRSPSAHSDPGSAVDSALCRACASWAADVDAAFEDVDDFCEKPVNPSADALEKREHTLMRLAGLDENKWAATCPLCKLFWASRVQSEGEGDYYLAGFSSRDTNYLMNSDKMLNTDHPAKGRGKGFSPAFLGVVPKKKGDGALGWDIQPDWFRRNGMLFRTPPDPLKKPSAGKRSREPSPSGAPSWTERGIWGREIGQSIDMSVGKGWLDHCKDHHQESFEHQGKLYHQGRCARRRVMVEMEGFRLIDCQQMPPQIVEASLAEKFVALSYVWGRDETQALPKAVRDAVTVTQELGLRYLWVDRLCLDDAEPHFKMAQIARMNEIYEGAELTIIAACSEDGLPGVGSTSRPQQPKYRFANSDITIMSSLKDPLASIKESAWYTRGWTYQEGILSRRRLIFTDEQMYWECGGMVCPETLVLPLDMYHDRRQQRMCDFMHPGLFNGVSFGAGSWEVWRPLPATAEEPAKEPSTMGIFREADRHIVKYTQRELKYDEDSLNAYLGISRQLEDTGKLFSLVGIPLWAPVSDAGPGRARTKDIFALSTSLWHHKDGQEVRRRPHMPSWTWAGWKGAVGLTSSLVTANLEGRPTGRKMRNDHDMIAKQLTLNEPLSLKWTYSPEMALLRPDGSVAYDFSPAGRRMPNLRPERYCLHVSDPLVLDRVKARTHVGGWMFNDVSVDVRLSRKETAAGGIRAYIERHGRGEQMTVLWLATVLWTGEEPKEVLVMLLVVQRTERGTWERVGRMRMGFAEEPRDVLKRSVRLEGLLERLPLRKLGDSIVIE